MFVENLPKGLGRNLPEGIVWDFFLTAKTFRKVLSTGMNLPEGFTYWSETFRKVLSTRMNLPEGFAC